jgi:hypothetical protein
MSGSFIKAGEQVDVLTRRPLSILRSFGLFHDTNIVLWSGNFAVIAF